MAIRIIREPEDIGFREWELCCFCHQPTAYWTALTDRAPGQQVACCVGCAGIFDPDVVPTKSEWWDYHAGRRTGEGE